MSTLDQTVLRNKERPGEGVVARLARWTIAHRRVTLVGWVAAVIALIAISSAVGARTANNFTLPGTESQKAIDLLQSDFPARSGDVDQVVMRAKHGSID